MQCEYVLFESEMMFNFSQSVPLWGMIGISHKKTSPEEYFVILSVPSVKDESGADIINLY